LDGIQALDHGKHRGKCSQDGNLPGSYSAIRPEDQSIKPMSG